jgi:hypothetical protein
MSTDWAKYSTPEETRHRARLPNDNGIVRMKAGDVRGVPLQVAHTPELGRTGLQPNRAHTDVVGEKTTEVRLKLFRLCEWVIRIG